MNREQYLAKRMWFHGAPAGDGRCGTMRHQAESTSSPVALPPSLADYYQRFQRGEPAPRLEDRAR